MNNQIILALRHKLEEITAQGASDIEVQRNALKEELQFYVLDCVYHHPEYSKWTMYGGSALRICHGLNRMSVDLDFEVAHPVTSDFLSSLKTEIEQYFKNTYLLDSNLFTIKTTNGRGLKLCFHVLGELGVDAASKQVHVKIDLNHFVAPKTVSERIPINHGQLSFVIKTYNMSSLMASKIAAIFLRGQRGVGDVVYEEKGRDIYDLLWYMGKKIVPDFDYINEKFKREDLTEVPDIKTLFNQITIKVPNSPNIDENLKQDLTPLFANQMFIENWLTNWRESFFRLLNEYEIRTVTSLVEIGLHQDFKTDIFSFVYWYATEEGKPVRVIYRLSDYWIDFGEGNLPLEVDESLGNLKIVLSGVQWDTWVEVPDKIKQYITLFQRKTEQYLKKTNKTVLGDSIETKLIRMTADNLNQKEQIVLNKSALLDSELDDLLK